MKINKVLRFDENLKFLVALLDNDKYSMITIDENKYEISDCSIFYLRAGIWDTKAPQYLIDEASEVLKNGKCTFVENVKRSKLEEELFNIYKNQIIPKRFKKNKALKKELKEYGYDNYKFLDDCGIVKEIKGTI